MSETAATANEAEYVRVSTAAARLDVAPSTLVSAIRRGEVDGFRLGPRGHWRVSAESLRQLIEERGQQ